MFNEKRSIIYTCLILSLIVILFKEQGEFLALDLGGSNFRVLLVKVKANDEQKVEMNSQIFSIPEQIMRGSGSEVRSHVVKRTLHDLYCLVLWASLGST